MQVEYVAIMSLPDEGWDIDVLEEACVEAARNAAKELFLEALKQREREILAPLQGEKKGGVKRYLITRLGLIIIWRQKLKRERDGRDSYLCPLDRAIRLG